MAIVWGGWVNAASGNGMRLGYDVTGSSTATHSSFAVAVYVQTRYGVSDSSNAFSMSGTPSLSARSISISHSGGRITHIGTWTGTVARKYGSITTTSWSASLSGIEAIPGTATVSATWRTPARAYEIPRPPLNAAARRVSDSEQVITWSSNYDSAASARPWSGVHIKRWDSTTQQYARIASVGWSATSFTDRTTVPGRRYRYWLESYNSTGSSGWQDTAITGYVATSPTAATGITARKDATDIEVAWSNTATYLSQVRVWHYSNGVRDQEPITTLTGAATSWTHTNAPTDVTHAYTVQGIADGVIGAESERTDPPIALLAAPNAPRLVSPVSTAVDAADGATLRWQHAPKDGTAQTQGRIQYRQAGTGAWTTVSVGAESEATIPAELLENGRTYEWQAQTRGQHASWSPWSPVATFTTSAKPLATILNTASIVPADRVTVSWAYYDPEGTAQAAWRATLYDAAGEILSQRGGSGTGSQWTPPVVLQDATDYRATVQVQDGAGVWSTPDTWTFRVQYAPPPVTTITPAWSEDDGTVTLTLTGGIAEAGQPEAVSVTVQRQTDGEWVTLATELPTDTTIVDQIPPLGTGVPYRTITVSDLPSQATSEPIIVDTTANGSWIWLNAGPGFDHAVRMRAVPQVTDDYEITKALVYYDGQPDPIEHYSREEKRAGSVAASLLPPASTPANIRAVVRAPGPICLRTPFGLREFTSIKAVKFTHPRLPVTHVTFDWHRIAHTEGEE